MPRLLFVVTVMCLVASLPLASEANVWTWYLDGSSLPQDSGWDREGDDLGVIVDLGGGNKGIQQVDDGDGYDLWTREHEDVAGTAATRFRVDSYSGTNINVLQLLMANGTDETSPAVAVGIRDDHFYLLRFLADSGDQPLLDLGAVVPGEFNTVLLYDDGLTDVVQLFWNGGLVYNAVTPADSPWGGYIEFGASSSWGWGGTSTVTFDYLGYGPGMIPEPSSVLALGAGLIGLLGAIRRRK